MAQPFLDHLIILIPHSALLSPPSWLSSAFHLYPGGTHADGRTANTLVLFPDGTYLELIAFLPHVTPDSRVQHRWGREREGHFVDYALSIAAGSGPGSSPEDRFARVRARVAEGSRSVAYSAPSAGGRTQEDGTDIRWAISFASAADGVKALTPGELPFWCLDRTPRDLRVPYGEPGNVKHPSGAKGVAAVDVTVASEEARDVYGFIQGAEGRDAGNGKKAWDLAVPEGSASELRVGVDAGVAEGKEKIKLTILTERGTEPRTIGGELAEGVELWIELKPEA
ncbi:glyoxalase-like domain-containing protein [Plectosphaerella cucumerina]|uniref:Glyoxalase-like domain-containing protein n=1 Tax=Plectosphaerella cucumerina TaxID=40658 RepID=A0A8K0X7F5_9PEZI|nr:glyoxalase-like domain-containing protein [Plectosphaerella cucumerina]